MASDKRKKIQQEKQKRLVQLKKTLASGSKYAEKQRLKRLGSQA
jgi:hypothetical protein